MDKFWLCAAVGFYLLQLSSAQIGLNISCRYAGVFHVEKNHRYSLTREDAIALCSALNSTIPTMEQMEQAFALGFETCRYGYIEDKIVVPRHTPYHLCAANNTGIYILSSNISDRYDTYCFNSSETREKVCDPVKKLYSIWPDDGSTIEIFNADGSRYIEGERFTEQTPLIDDDSSVGSGSPHDRGTTDPSIIRTSRFPHHEGYPTSTSSYFERDDGSEIYDDHKGHDQSESPDHESTNLHSHEKQEDIAQERKTLGHDENKYDSSAHLSPNITGEMSNNRRDHENATEGQQVYEEIPLWWPSEEYEGEHHVSSTRAATIHLSSHEETSTQQPRTHSWLVLSTDNKKVQHPNEGAWDESSKEEDDDEDEDDNDVVEGSGHINPESDLEWSSSGDKEFQPSNTTELSSKEVRLQDSTHDAVLHGAHSGNNSEHRYSTNGTRAPGTVSLSDDEHYSATPAVFSSDDFFKQEDSTKIPPDAVPFSPETEDAKPTATTVDVFHPVFSSTSDREENLEDEPFYHSVIFFNESAENEELDNLSSVDQHGQTNNSATNTTFHDVLKIPITPSESDHEKSSQTDVVSNEESTQNPFHDVYPEWSSEESNTSTSSEEAIPGLSSSDEHEHNNESFYTEISGGSHNEEHMKNHTMLITEHSELDNEEQYSTNTSGNYLQSGVAHPGESEHEERSSHTAVASSDNGKQEGYTEDPLVHSMLPGWDNEDVHPTNSTRIDLYGIILPNESKHDKEDTADTAVVSNGGSDHEDSSEELLTQEVHPVWNNEEKHPVNASVNDLTPGVFPPVENSHEKESSPTAVSSSDYVREENSTHDSTLHGQFQEWSKDDEYSPNRTVDEVLAGIISSAENSEEKNEHTGWNSEDKHLTNASRDSILSGSVTNGEKEHDVLYTDEVSQGVNEDSTPVPVRDSEDNYTTKSSATVFPGIVPRRGINQKNKTDHTVVLSEESTQDPQVYGSHPGWSSEDEHLINDTENSVLPGVFPEIDSASDRLPTPSSDSSNPDEHGSKVSRKAVTPLIPESRPRKAEIPEWLIVVASLLALALILGVCIAVNSRRRCGQKQKLIINNGKGGIDEKNMGGLNGEASKSHEMVHLVRNEKPEDQIGPHDEFLAIDETQNQQEVALKSGM